MDDIAGQAILWTCWVIGIVIFWVGARKFVPSLSFKGWGSLSRDFGVREMDLPPGLVMRRTSLRVGIFKTDMANLGLDSSYLYLQRCLGSNVFGTLRISLAQITLLEAPRLAGGFLNLPVAGIFRVNQVEVWIGAPLAEEIIGHLA